jgi:hypothetical protein
MEREKGSDAPPHIVTIAGKQFDILQFLDFHRMPVIYVNETRPGDDEALKLLYTLENLGVTSDEYRTAMPNFFRLAAKKEGGFDADLIIVARYLMKRVVDRRGGERKLLYQSTPEDRIAYFADVYGQLQAMKDFVWRSPELADHKKNIIEFAKKEIETPWPWNTKAL